MLSFFIVKTGFLVKNMEPMELVVDEIGIVTLGDKLNGMEIDENGTLVILDNTTWAQWCERLKYEKELKAGTEDGLETGKEDYLTDSSDITLSPLPSPLPSPLSMGSSSEAPTEEYLTDGSSTEDSSDMTPSSQLSTGSSEAGMEEWSELPLSTGLSAPSTPSRSPLLKPDDGADFKCWQNVTPTTRWRWYEGSVDEHDLCMCRRCVGLRFYLMKNKEKEERIKRAKEQKEKRKMIGDDATLIVVMMPKKLEFD